ncbi:helix-turn-helix domain-containing protein [Chryseobacterium wanjuense]|nr:helix-turn-helix domain-containing protein [Chryseobacterium wanjuense]
MEFLSWMKRITDRLDIISEKMKSSQKFSAISDGDQLLDNQDVLLMLKISNRSLQRFRSAGQLPYYTLSGKLYYKLSDVRQFVRERCSHPVKR